MMTTLRQRQNFRSRTLCRKEFPGCRWRNVFDFALARLDDSLIRQRLKAAVIYSHDLISFLWLNVFQIDQCLKNFRPWPRSSLRGSCPCRRWGTSRPCRTWTPYSVKLSVYRNILWRRQSERRQWRRIRCLDSSRFHPPMVSNSRYECVSERLLLSRCEERFGRKI